MEKLWRLAFESMSDELEDPADYKQRHGNFPESCNERGRQDEKQREDDHRNADGVAKTIGSILVAG